MASPEDDKLRTNERLKLLATAMNNIALALAIAGFVGPIVAGARPGASHLFWMAAASVVHAVAQFVLGRLRA